MGSLSLGRSKEHENFWFAGQAFVLGALCIDGHSLRPRRCLRSGDIWRAARGGVNWDDENAAAEGYYFKTTADDGTATYYKPNEVKDAPKGSTLELIQGYAASTESGIAALPANSTLNLNGNSIWSAGEDNGAVITSLGNSTIVNEDDGWTTINSFKAVDDSTTTFSGDIHIHSNITSTKLVLSQNASLTAESVVGDVEMGTKSTLSVSNYENKDSEAIGIDGNLTMDEGAEGAEATVYATSKVKAVGINNTKPIAVHNGQKLTVKTYIEDDSKSADIAISGDLTVGTGADVEISTTIGYDYDVVPSTAIGGNLVAAAGNYWGAIKGENSSVTGGSFSINPASFVAEGHGVKYAKGTYTVLPDSELNSEITNLYWGAKKDDTSPYENPSYTINYTSSKNSTGVYEVSFLKENDSGTFESVYNSRAYYDEGGVREINDYGWFHRMLLAVGDDNISGIYKFQVTELDGENAGATATCEDTYEFKAPENKLGTATDLHWNESKPTVACFTLPENASGYSVTLYRKGDDEAFHPAGGYTSYNSNSKYVERDFNDKRFQLLTKPGTYKFAVRAISSNLEEILDGPESELSSGEFNLGDVTKKVTEGVTADTATNGKEFLSKEDPSVVGAAMTSDKDARETIEKAEEAYAAVNNVETKVESSIEAIDTAKVSAIGAAYNAENGTSVELKIGEASQKRIDNDPSLKSVVQFSMDLKQKDASGNEISLGKTDNLAVPVCVTIPVPNSIKGNLRIHHYSNDGSYETIWPVVFTENGQTYARFYVTHFSDFVLLVEDENGSTDNPSSGDNDNPGTGGGSTIVTPPSTDPSGPSTPGVIEPSNPGTDEPSKPEEPTTPDTPAVDGPEVGTVATVGSITCKVTAAGEVEITKIPAGKKSVTIPAKVKIGGKSCTVTGIASGLFKSSKATTLIIKSKDLTKKSVKNALKGSKVKVVKIKVSGKKSVNKKYFKQYKKIFTKKVCGKKVTVK